MKVISGKVILDRSWMSISLKLTMVKSSLGL